MDERKRMRDLSNEVHDKCNHVFVTAYGLPCACILATCEIQRKPLSIEQIHHFWSTLKIGDVVVDTTAAGDETEEDEGGEEGQFFQDLCGEVQQSDPALRRSISAYMFAQLYPDEAEYHEPEIYTNQKGRPRRSSSTRRKPSAWEYVDRGRGRGRGRGCTSSSPHLRRARSTSMGSSMHILPRFIFFHFNSSMSLLYLQQLTVTYFTANGRLNDISTYPFVDHIPRVILPFVEGYVDVRADGNCGFRVMAHWLHGSEDYWQLMRHTTANELAANLHIYQNIPNHGIERALQRIRWEGGECDSRHWMVTPEDLYPIASMWNALIVLVCFGFKFHDYGQCTTILPLYSRSTNIDSGPEHELIICHLDTFPHFIRLDLQPGFPLPPIGALWNHYHGDSVIGLENRYRARLNHWRALVGQL